MTRAWAAAGLAASLLCLACGDASAPISSPATPGNQAAASAPAAAGALGSLGMERLRAPNAGEPAPAARNLFRFGARVPAPSVQASRRVVAPVRPPGPPPPPPGPPPPPPIPLKFVGLIEQGSRGRVVVLSDNRGNVFYGGEGDIIEGRYRIHAVTGETTELSYVDGRGRQVLRLTGQ